MAARATDREAAGIQGVAGHKGGLATVNSFFDAEAIGITDYNFDRLAGLGSAEFVALCRCATDGGVAGKPLITQGPQTVQIDQGVDGGKC